MRSRTHYQYELAEVQHALLRMGDAAEHMLVCALRAFEQNDVTVARLTVHSDDEIDARRLKIEEQILPLIASQQPLASDLRFLLGTLRIADELERIGDYAEGIATLVTRNPQEPLVDPPATFATLASQVRMLLRASVEAFTQRDTEAARGIIRADDEIDRLDEAIRDHMVRYLQACPVAPTRALHILFVAHNLERIADYAVNIAERTLFIGACSFATDAIRYVHCMSGCGA